MPGQQPAIRTDDPERLVRGLYRALLLRDPSPQDVSGWCDALAGNGSANDLLDTLLQSDEYLRRQACPIFVPPGHFYSPICDPAEAADHLASVMAAVPEAVPGVAIDRAAMIRTWNVLSPLVRDAPFPEKPTKGFHYCLDNPNYSWGDGFILQAMLRLHRPRRLIEIGSGWSSGCTFDTVERYLSGKTTLTFIEPYPDLLRDMLGDAAEKVKIIEARVQDVPLAVFDELAAGDFLFIDSTHVLRTGSDVCRELLDILPRLAPGVFVHLHDMFWPFEYPHQWVVEENRSWNELQAVRAFLIGNTGWEVVWFSDYMARLEGPRLQAVHAKMLCNPCGALWLRRTGL